ncbi:lysosome membrane protein 2-like [Haliotis rufescens]|uniref:lysosome membrane protein 2-like n=1 Tax=Haliotis rufescens TaxID=6454 RepID=UPI00201F1972|nr:lysosome membrane protein 2-like [Haliotis rufescens]
MVSKSSVCASICCVLGVALVVVGGALIVVFKNLIHSNIEKQVNLKEGSETYNDWLDPPVPIYFQVWVLDVINHDEVVSQGKRPSVVQKGPYTYREHRGKVNITFNDNDTVTYREDRSFEFKRHMSAGPESETFTTVNLPMLTIANMIRFEYGFIQELADLILEGAGETLFLNLSVADILWGYEDKLLKDVDEILQRTINKTIDDHFGLFYNQNGSDDGVYNINTGVKDPSHFALIRSWNFNSNLPYWTSPSANMINGTDGTMFPPFVDKSAPLYLFSSDICRSLDVKFNHDYDFKDISLASFVAPDSTFLNVTLNPDNAGFCTPPGNCLPSGLLNVSACRQGAPVVMSQPHFLAADQSVINGVEGMHPMRAEHQTFVDVEPMTGVAMNVAKKLQINVYVEPVRHIKETEKITPVFLPILWINESAAIDDKTARKFRDKVQEPIKITEAVQYGLITLGAFILICVIVIFIRRTMCGNNDIHLQDLSGERDPLLN